MEFKRRRRKATDCGWQWIYDTRCGGYRIVESHINGYSVRYYVLKRCGDNTTRMVSIHRKMTAAKRALSRICSKGVVFTV